MLIVGIDWSKRLIRANRSIQPATHVGAVRPTVDLIRAYQRGFDPTGHFRGQPGGPGGWLRSPPVGRSLTYAVQFPSSTSRSRMPTEQSSSKSAGQINGTEQPLHGPQTASNSSMSEIPTTPSASRS